MGRSRLTPQDYANRYRSIIMGRRLGQSLQEIGDAHGITRERVRQILDRYGDQSLIGRQAPHAAVMKAASIRRRTRQCAECGGDFIPVNKKIRFCSRKCAQVRRNTRNERGPQMMAMRREGATWREIAEAFGLKTAPEAYMTVKRWADDTGADMSDALGRISRHYRRAA